MAGRRSRPRGITGAALAAALVLVACTGDDDAEPTTTGPVEGASPEIVTRSGAAATGGSATPIDLLLREGEPATPTSESRITVTEGTALDPADVAALLARLPEWDLPPDDSTPFARPAVTLPPPLIGATVDTPFPPADDVAAPAVDGDGQLEVVRVQPVGEVDVAPFVTITFDEPMVPLATLDDLDASDVPAVITPAVEGRWRWVGTRTLRFEVEPGATDRLPAATEYRVEVPAGTTSEIGHRLAAAVAFEFATPPPRLTSFVGERDRLGLEPVFVAVFDQRVDPAAVLPTITVSAASQPVELRLASDDEVADDHDAARAVADALEGRAVAFRPVGPLPVDTPLTITVGPGTPSDEGPLTGTEPKTYVARTFGALEVRRTECGYGDGCVPLTPLTIELTNELDLDAFAAEQITVTPRVPGLAVDVYGPVIQLVGNTDGNTDYTVTLDAGLSDVFGQTLGTDTTVSFSVGPAEPAIIGLQQERVTVDPSADAPTVSIRTVNHDSVRVIAWAVAPTEVRAFREYLERTWSDVEPRPPDWQVVLDEEVEIAAEPDRYVETAIDLTDAFAAAGSQLVVRVEPTESYTSDDRLYWQNRPTVAWVQSTTLAVDAVHDGDELHIWTTDLVTGEPVGNVAVELLGDGRVARTDADGLVTVPLSDTPITGLFANAGDRTSFLVLDWYEGLRATSSVDESRWYVFDDRGIYRPGETARITGWVRELAWSDEATLRLYDDVSIRWRASDPQGSELGAGTADVNALGGFNLTVDIPEGANLGTATVELTLAGGALPPGSGYTSHALQIEEYRRPEFEVVARPESVGPYFVGTPATVAVDATYYAGGPLADAEVTWLVTTTRTTYRPPGWDDYQFGIWQPWWYAGEAGFGAAAGFDGDWCVDCPPGGATEYDELAGRTDAAGSHYLEFELGATDADLPSSVTAEATVLDVDRQAWASRTDLLVHPADVYVGLRSDRTFVEAGTPIRYGAVVTDIDGTAVAGAAVEVTAGRIEWSTRGGESTEQVVDPVTCAFTSSADPSDGSMVCEFPTEVGGEYRVTAVVTDASGRHNRTQSTMWVAGAGAAPTRRVEQEQLTIVPDRETYVVGDTAEVLVQAPFDAVSGLMTISHHQIVRTEPFSVDDGSAVLEIPIDDDAVPEVTVQFDVVGTAPRTADDGTPLPDAPVRPAFASGQVTLSVPPVTRALTVDAAPASEQLEPGDETSVTVTVTGPDGSPVEGAEVALVVVDEAVLALTGYELADPLDVFYGPLWSNVTAQYTRSTVLLTRDDLLGGDGDEGAATAAEPEEADDAAGGEAVPPAPTTTVPAGGATDPADEGGEPIDVREQFEPLAVFAPGQVTGDGGTVTVDVPLPDTATRYRVMAVAVDGADHFGKDEATITARLPLTVRASAPRFANYGDRFELPVVVQNQTDEPVEVQLAVQTANLAVDGSDDGTTGRLVTVPADDRVEVRFPMGTDEAGIARVRLVAVGGGGSDAVATQFAVYTPATQEAFATYGVIDEDGGVVAQPLEPPTGVIGEFGGLEIGTSTTALQALTDAVISLEEYPYTTVDGYSSRILAVASLRDVLDAFAAEGLPDPDQLDRRVERDIDAVVALQNDDGGWSWWARGLRSEPWPTLHAAHALVAAERAGYAVPTDALGRALAHLDDIESHIPAEYSPDIRITIRAYAIHVRTLAGDRDVAEATAIVRDGGIALQLDALAWLWPAIDDAAIRDEIERRITNAATETAGAATFATAYSEDAYVIAVSDRRSDGVILDALVSEAPRSDLIPKVVAGLLGQQRRGHWDSAQDDAFVLLALQRYFRTFEAATPDLVARAWLGSDYVSEQPFRGRTTDRATTLVPMGVLTALPGPTDLVLQNDGTGRLYYRLGLRYAPSDLTLDARDEGFVVERRYEAVDDPADVRREADGTWIIRAGAAVRVTVTMVADARRTHVALVDPLPAGLEPVNPAFAVSQTFAPDDTGADDGTIVPFEDWCWCWQWFEHQNLRDDRAEAFTSALAGGTYEYTYIARATTPGVFVVPPARAEELYAPEVFGRSASDTLVVG
jgi:uncharacterized protein YfaS (alpha-2-macroglobulin family)